MNAGSWGSGNGGLGQGEGDDNSDPSPTAQGCNFREPHTVLVLIPEWTLGASHSPAAAPAPSSLLGTTPEKGSPHFMPGLDMCKGLFTDSLTQVDALIIRCPLLTIPTSAPWCVGLLVYRALTDGLTDPGRGTWVPGLRGDNSSRRPRTQYRLHLGYQGCRVTRQYVHSAE